MDNKYSVFISLSDTLRDWVAAIERRDEAQGVVDRAQEQLDRLSELIEAAHERGDFEAPAAPISFHGRVIQDGDGDLWHEQSPDRFDMFSHGRWPATDASYFLDRRAMWIKNELGATVLAGVAADRNPNRDESGDAE